MISEEEFREALGRYSVDELLDVLEHIDKGRLPERYALALEELKKRRAELERGGSGEGQDIEEAPPPADDGEERVFSGIERRFAAYFIDGLLLIPLFFLNYMLLQISKPAEIALVVPQGLIGLFYLVYFHARWGQSIGKMLLGIKVVDLSGMPIGWRRAFWRYMPVAALDVLWMSNRFYSLLFLPDSILAGMDPGEADWDGLFHDTAFVLDLCIAGLGFLWGLVDSVVLLLNSRRRALHDFIAGTVVINKQALAEKGIVAAGSARL